MDSALLPQAALLGTPDNISQEAITKRVRAEITRGMLETERASFISQWKELNDFILPRRGRFYVTDVNRGSRRTQAIIDSTGTFAAGTLAAGLMSAVTPSSRPWFRLTTADPDMNEVEEVKEWLYLVTDRMLTAFLKSNFYTALPVMYQDMGTFGTHAMMQMEDAHSVFRFYNFPVGSYCLANDDTGRIRVFQRTFRLTVRQLVERWGNIKDGKPDFMRGEPSAITMATQQLWRTGSLEAWIDICHLIQPNWSYDGRKVESRFKKYNSIYYEQGMPNQQIPSATMGLLADEGFDEFPVYAGRWSVNAEDVYGTNCPGMTALGDIRQLQTGEKRKSQAIEKMINPPMIGPSRLRSVKSSILPADITFFDTSVNEPGFRPVHEVNFGAAFGPLSEDQNMVRGRIREAFYADLFLMLSGMDNPKMTATEVLERKDEKLAALGPMYGQYSSDVLDPVIDRTFNMMYRKGLFPPAPDVLAGQPLRVEYISPIAQALKAQGAAGVERFVGFAGQIAAAQVDQSPVWDTIDTDHLVDDYAEMVGISPLSIRSPEERDAIRAQRAKAQQAAAAAEQAQKAGAAAKDLSQSSLEGDTALSRLLAGRGAADNITAVPQGAPAGAGI